MKLYGSYTSPYARHCRIALWQSDIDYTFIAIDQIESAEISPTKRVPFLVDDELTLSDSSSILKYIREKSGQRYLPCIQDFDQFCFANTLMDSAANVFYLQKQGLKENAYVDRQQARINQGLTYLNALPVPSNLPLSDGQWRIACFIDWGLFRQRFSLDGLKSLQQLLALANTDEHFKKSYPFDPS